MGESAVSRWGELRAVPSRGTLLGNRGIVHDDENRVIRSRALAVRGPAS